MPSCNLRETIHNKWLQQSRNTGECLYAAIVDNIMRAFMEITQYRRYLKGGRGGKGLDKAELRLRQVQRSLDPEMIAEAMKAYLGAGDVLTKEKGLEGVEIFGSMKRKLDLPPSLTHDFCCSHKVNYSIPTMGTRSTRARAADPGGSFGSNVSCTAHHVCSGVGVRSIRVAHCSPFKLIRTKMSSTSGADSYEVQR